MENTINTNLSKEHVLESAKSFLGECNWQLEIDEKVIDIPQSTELLVHSRAYIQADSDDVFLGNHYEAVVYLGGEKLENNVTPIFGILKMYFNLEGEFVSEDRFSKHS